MTSRSRPSGRKIHARFVVNLGGRRLEGREHPGAVLGDGEGGDDDDHTTDLPMADNLDVLLAINAGAYLF